MKIFLIILGVIALLLGAVWVLQGFNVFPGSAMSGHRKWILIGGVVFVVGAGLVFFAASRKASKG